MKIRLLLLFAVLCLSSASAASAQDSVRLTVKPQAVDIGTLYNGTTVQASGAIPADSEAVVRFLGVPSKVHMKQTAKVGGVVWMNTASVDFEKAPSVCIVSSTQDLKKLETTPGPVDDLSLAGLRKSIVIDARECKGLDVFAEFLKMKKKEGLYREVSGNISYGKISKGVKTFQVSIPLPSRLSPGVYTVDVAAVRNGQIVARGQETIDAKLVGAPALMASLAFNHSILYGFLATLIALLAGLGIGLVFQSKGAH
ncbi:MAG: TIGR02186 family protein [Syntrophobacteraceae bacterium]|nr:TIGR02186 family protein [Syntrophobacteraceae bacterium]